MRTHQNITVIFGSLSAIALVVSAAHGADPAQILFDRGVEHMQAGRYEKGCPAIEESYRLDPRPGTLFTLSECEAKRGRTATAVRRYDEYLAMFAILSPDKKAKQGEREKIARAQKAALGPQIPVLTLILPPAAPRETVVKFDGAVLPKTSVGVPFLVDPGSYHLSTQAPGGEVSDVDLVIKNGEKKRVPLHVELPPVVAPVSPPAAPPVIIPRITTLPPPARPVVAPPTGTPPTTPPRSDVPWTPPPPPPTPPQNAAADAGPSGQRVAAFLTVSGGGIGVILGGIMGGLALEKKGTIDANCNVQGIPEACNTVGKKAADSAKTFGIVSTVGFAIGLAGLGIGTVLFLTEPERPEPPSASADRRRTQRAEASPVRTSHATIRWLSVGALSVGQEDVLFGVRGAW